MFGLIFTRSSWNRLGLSISSVVQPGYVGVLNLELMNNSSNPIALYSGLRIVQVALFSFNGKNHDSYLSSALSKYVANSEPNLSNIQLDHDLEVIRSNFSIDE
jgi:dCTP deaminase